MAVVGEALPLRQARVEADVRLATRICRIAFAAALLLVLALGIPGLAAALHADDSATPGVLVVKGLILDGRGDPPQTSEILVQYPTSETGAGPTAQRWMPISTFRLHPQYSQIEVAYPPGRPDAAQVASECGCLPRREPFPLITLSFAAAVAVGMGLHTWARTGRRPTDAAASTPVKVWWAHPRSSMLRLYDPNPPAGSGAAVGPMVGTLSAPYGYRGIVRDGDVLLLTGGRGRRGAWLSTSAGPLPLRHLLNKPSRSKGSTASGNGAPFWLASLGRSKDPVGAHEGRRLDLVLALRLGLGPLLLLFVAWRFPFPWSVAGFLGLVPIGVGLLGTLWARVGSEDDLDARAAEQDLVQRGLLHPQVLAPPPPPPPLTPGDSGLSGTPILSDGRDAGESGHWLGSRASIAACGIISIAWLAMAPVLLALPVVVGVLFWRRSPRPVVKRYYRPSLPPWAGFAMLGVAATAWYQAVDGDGHGTVPWGRALGFVLFVPAVVAAVRLATAGITVGRDEWVIRNLWSTVRIPAAAVVSVARREPHPIPSAGIVIHRRNADPVVVPRWTLSVAVARRMVRDYDRGTILPETPTGPAGPAGPTSRPHPLIPSPYGRTF